MSEMLDLLECSFLQSDDKIFIKYWIRHHGCHKKIITKSWYVTMLFMSCMPALRLLADL